MANGGAPPGAPPLPYLTRGSRPSRTAAAGTLQIVVSLVVHRARELEVLVFRVRIAERNAETGEPLAEVGQSVLAVTRGRLLLIQCRLGCVRQAGRRPGGFGRLASAVAGAVGVIAE